jgi:leucyl aminopeptidase (aminopeptidase T)
VEASAVWQQGQRIVIRQKVDAAQVFRHLFEQAVDGAETLVSGLLTDSSMV